jgi:hypothetical protein
MPAKNRAVSFGPELADSTDSAKAILTSLGRDFAFNGGETRSTTSVV